MMSTGLPCDQPVAPDPADPGQRLRRAEQLPGGIHAQHASAPEGSVVDRIDAGQCAGMRRGRLGGERTATRLDDDDRLVARRRTRRGHELARLADRLHVEQDCAGVGITAEVIEQVTEIDVG
jgi:hypothetical protein